MGAELRGWEMPKKRKIGAGQAEESGVAPAPDKVMATLSAEYLAGFIDGEGCITIERKLSNKKHYATPAVLITNSHFGILDAIRAQYGGYISYRPAHGKNRETWRWSIHARMARRLLKDIYPYLIVKKSQAEIVMGMLYSTYGKRMTSVIKEDRAWRLEKIRALNKKGPSTPTPNREPSDFYRYVDGEKILIQ